jgi:hypothetical protein
VFDKLDDYFTEEVSLPEAELPEPSTSYHPVQRDETAAPELLDEAPVVPTVVAIDQPRSSSLINGDVSEANVLSYCRRPACAFITTIPATVFSHYTQAVRGRDSSQWIAAINSELSAMSRVPVWEVVDRTPDMKTVGTTWVFKVKDNHNANIVFKARLCAQGFSQTQGVNFSKTFTPTGCLNSLRSLISFAAAQNLDFQQLDVKTAFLNADLDEEVYLSIPQGVNKDNKKKCLKLKKVISGLKQAPLAWYNCLTTWLVSVGFAASVADPCVFYRLDENLVWLFIHVDNIAVFGKNLDYFKSEIKLEFDMKDLGQANMMLGIKILHEPSATILSQAHYVNSVLDLYGMTGCQTVSTPLVPNLHLQPASVEEIDRFKSLGVNFRSAVGSLSYLSSTTRPDIAFAVSLLLQYLESPGIHHWEVFTHFLQYLAGTKSLSLVYLCGITSHLLGYTNADWGNCLTSRRLVTGYLTLFNNHLISWQTKKQPVVSLSSCEAEYCALTDFACELLWFRQFVEEVGLIKLEGPTVVHEDNQGCIAVANFDANTNSRRMKHIEIQVHFMREVIKNCKIHLQYTPTADMLADILTKSVPCPALVRSLQRLALL